MRCLSSFTTEGILQKHDEACTGLNSRPTRTEMSKEGENHVFFQKVGNQLKVPFIIYADLEAIIEKIKSSKGNLYSTKELHCENKPTHRMWLCVQGSEKRWRSLNCRICEKPLVVESFLDSISVFSMSNTGEYCQQAHTQKMAFQRHIYRALISTQTTRQSG